MINVMLPVDGLKFPDDAAQIARMSLVEKEQWYLGNDPMDLDTVEFRRFWFWCYQVPMRLKRTAYWFKFW